VVLGLPFREVWAVDFEFIANPGDRPIPVCMVARELGSGRLLRLWQHELPARPPFSTGDDTLFVAYLASAEIGCFLALGWPVPTRVLDLFVEFRAETNGLPLAEGRSLLGALSHHKIRSITSDEKQTSRALVMRGGPWSDAERQAVLDYCQTDVDPLGALLERMLPRITATPQGLGQALLRGRYMAAVARMEWTGVPIDTGTLATIRNGWPVIKLDLIAAVDKDFGVFEGATFKAGLFAAWLRDAGIEWPRTETGRLQLDQDTFKDMVQIHPQLAPLRELRHALSELRLESLAVGQDSRNRTLLGAFGASSGRNTPSNSKFIFGPSVWLRGLIKPEPGRAVAYVDWESQEVAIAAALSGDEQLLDAVRSGDPYLAFAVRAGLAPAGATKASHGRIRDVCKACVLGVNYGMRARTLATRTGTSVLDAERLLRALAAAFPVFTEWSERAVDTGVLTGRLATVFGWPVHVTGNSRPTMLRNFPMQANGAEMLRIACCLATERGVHVCAPVHDALLIEAAAFDIGDAVATTQAAMSEAARAVLSGFEIGTDVAVVKWPNRYSDPRGEVMWTRVLDLLARRGCKG
jgi:DNA polymerase-1